MAVGSACVAVLIGVGCGRIVLCSRLMVMNPLLSLLLPSAIKLLTSVADQLHLSISHDGSNVFARLSYQTPSGTSPLVSMAISQAGHITMRLFSDGPAPVVDPTK